VWGAWRGLGVGVAVLCVLLRAYQIKRLCVFALDPSACLFLSNFRGGGDASWSVYESSSELGDQAAGAVLVCEYREEQGRTEPAGAEC
jgi:hypothetical protein